jgi:hypothetical protein
MFDVSKAKRSVAEAVHYGFQTHLVNSSPITLCAWRVVCTFASAFLTLFLCLSYVAGPRSRVGACLGHRASVAG